ncbi:type I glyceraldehyde-3-phosphate dehydrogenase [Desulfocurvibacter africanus]|uniref:Glyceraldehyde-3-phosphate dehydrogenase n=1 Tax=Desulfocurvibacter africanus subsp. africanus str. Walvis Bay TaxID=690850 RepID=F3YVF5_DESAF|nr:type I glyceraldehyde-3-phosphate dehydrogenase [Desulfocurvibacter africanus]EGJ48547.1 glyceraldehyde-3-phosphate dehydrogenase, type I [Desulfocurvibacter africanus subsp. africanus str. Walvis Bay]
MDKLRIGINGFGRIGRQVLKAMRERHGDSLVVVAVNDLFDTATNVHLLEFDTNYGRTPFEVRAEGTDIHYGGWNIKSFASRDPKEIPWGDLGVDLVVEATGIFTTGPKARAHLDAGARKVIISAPAKEEDVTVVLGVNEQDYDPARHHIVSNASCTTNCLAPAAKVVHEAFGIVSGLMCTVHAYTNDQRILDLAHRDLRRARAAGQNIIPTTTGAAKAVALVIPALKGRIDGYALRVPTPTVSVVDFACNLERETNTEELRKVLREAAEGPLAGILGYSDRPLVSMDFKGDPHSGIVEADFTRMQNSTMAKLVIWYDNEWGYSCRVADLAAYIHKAGVAR